MEEFEDMANMILEDELIMSKLQKDKHESRPLIKEKSFHAFSSQGRLKKSVCKKTREKFWNKLCRENKLKDVNTREQLIMHYAYLVNWIVNRLPVTSLKGMDKDDLIGYGTIGLIEAVDRFDHTKSSNFESFAITRIRGSIYDQLRASDHLSRGSRKRVKMLMKASSLLEASLGRYPSNSELAKELSLSVDALREIQKEAQIGIYSLDDKRDSDGDGVSMIETISSGSALILDDLEESELKEILIKAVDCLPEREKIVIGLYHYKKLTFREIAEVMEFSESRASQLHARAISLLKSKMLKEKG